MLRSALHRLIDELPDSELAQAWSLLDALAERFDPLLRAAMNAPVDDVLLTEEEIALLAQARTEHEQGETVSWEDVFGQPAERR